MLQGQKMSARAARTTFTATGWCAGPCEDMRAAENALRVAAFMGLRIMSDQAAHLLRSGSMITHGLPERLPSLLPATPSPVGKPLLPLLITPPSPVDNPSFPC